MSKTDGRLYTCDAEDCTNSEIIPFHSTSRTEFYQTIIPIPTGWLQLERQRTSNERAQEVYYFCSIICLSLFVDNVTYSEEGTERPDDLREIQEERRGE